MHRLAVARERKAADAEDGETCSPSPLLGPAHEAICGEQ